MTNKKRSIFFTLVAVLLIVSSVFAGCKNVDDSTSDPVAETEGEEQVVSEDVTEITIWCQKHEDWQVEWRQKWMVDTFNSTNDLGIKVNLEIIPGDAWEQKMTGAQATGQTPDIVHYAYNVIVNSARLGEILPLNDYVSQEALEDIYPAIQEMVTYDGKIYAYPELVEPAWVLYYRKDLVEAAGYDGPPTTMDELVDYARVLTTDTEYGLSLPVDAVTLGWTMWGMRYNVSGHRLIDDNWEKSLANDEAYYQIAEFYKTVMDEGLAPLQSSAPYVAMDDFLAGEVAMKFCGSWGIGQIRNAEDSVVPIENIGVAVSPTFDGNQAAPTASTGGWTLAIDGMSKYPEEAGQFIEWFLAGDPEIMIEFFTTAQFGKYPVRKSVDEALGQDENATNDEWYKTVSSGIVPYCVAETIFPFDINIAFGQAIERVYLEGMDPSESFAIADDEIQAIIENQGIAGTNPLN